MFTEVTKAGIRCIAEAGRTGSPANFSAWMKVLNSLGAREEVSKLTWPGSETVGNVAGRPTDPLTELKAGCEISNPHDKQSHGEFTAACKTEGDLLRETSWISWGLRCGLRNSSRS